MLKKAVRQYNVLRGDDIVFKKNDKDKVYVVCKDRMVFEAKAFMHKAIQE
jgi:hypothetical protein